MAGGGTTGGAGSGDEIGDFGPFERSVGGDFWEASSNRFAESSFLALILSEASLSRSLL